MQRVTQQVQKASPGPVDAELILGIHNMNGPLVKGGVLNPLKIKLVAGGAPYLEIKKIFSPDKTNFWYGVTFIGGIDKNSNTLAGRGLTALCLIKDKLDEIVENSADKKIPVYLVMDFNLGFTSANVAVAYALHLYLKQYRDIMDVKFVVVGGGGPKPDELEQASIIAELNGILGLEKLGVKLDDPKEREKFFCGLEETVVNIGTDNKITISDIRKKFPATPPITPPPSPGKSRPSNTESKPSSRVQSSTAYVLSFEKGYDRGAVFFDIKEDEYHIGEYKGESNSLAQQAASTDVVMDIMSPLSPSSESSNGAPNSKAISPVSISTSADVDPRYSADFPSPVFGNRRSNR